MVVRYYQLMAVRYYQLMVVVKDYLRSYYH